MVLSPKSRAYKISSGPLLMWLMLGRIVQDLLQNLDEDVGSRKVEAAQK